MMQIETPAQTRHESILGCWLDRSHHLCPFVLNPLRLRLIDERWRPYVMAQLKLVPPPFRAFPYRTWNPVLRALCDEYRANLPSPHIYLADFLDEDMARAAAREFPGPKDPESTENHSCMIQPAMFPGVLGKVVDELNSSAFVEWISDLTGITGLVSDPMLDGGGSHQMRRGDLLNLHADCTVHRHQQNWRRRVTLNLYLTPHWRDEWGGALEFWNSATRTRVARYPSLFNHAVIFNTDDRSLHGFPDPLQCPEKISRNSLAIYYYTIEDKPRLVARATDSHACPQKKIFGLSHRWASRVLGWMTKGRQWQRA